MIRRPRPITCYLLLGLLLAGCGGETPDPTVSRRVDPSQVRADWMSLFGNAGLAYSFVTAVETWFFQQGLESYLTVDGRLEVPGQDALVELDELARKCANLQTQAWNDAIAAHFGELDALVRLLEFRKTPAWDEAKTRLRIRLHTDAYFESAGADAATLVARRDLPGLMTCVVLDDDKTALIVPRSDLDVWDRPVSAVFAIALQNTKAELTDKLDLDRKELPPFGTLRVVTGDSFYAASALLWLEEWPELLGQHGAFVVAPWQRAMFVWRFDDPDDANAVQALYEFADRILGEQIDALSPDVYWRRTDGTFERIQIERDASGTLSAIPPADLIPLLKR